MAADAPEKLSSRDAIKTYRYLRIGMVGAVVLLGASIGFERWKVGEMGMPCWQTSISAYYYTPVRSIFVGGLMVIGFALIMIKGRGWFEDLCLNFAGMLAPVVAVVPTGDLGGSTTRVNGATEKVLRCEPSAMAGAVPADVVEATVDNNFIALLIAGFVGLAVAVVIALVVNRGARAAIETVQKGTRRSLVATGVALVIGLVLISVWDGFSTGAHGKAAGLMFVFLILAVAGKAWEHRTDSTRAYFRWYTGIGLAMVLGAIAITVFKRWLFADHTIFALEAWEIGLFALFWIIQTAENWDERVSSDPGVPPAQPVRSAEAARSA